MAPPMRTAVVRTDFLRTARASPSSVAHTSIGKAVSVGAAARAEIAPAPVDCFDRPDSLFARLAGVTLAACTRPQPASASPAARPMGAQPRRARLSVARNAVPAAVAKAVVWCER